MKNFVKVFGIIAIVAVIGFSFAACDEDSGPSGTNPGGSGTDGGNTGSGGGGLVGKWYASQGMADAGDTPVFEFRSGGKYIGAGMDQGMTYTSTSNTFTLYYSGQFIAKYNYSISGTVLTCDNADQPGSGLMVGTWYKPR